MTEQLSALADNEIALEDAEHIMASMQPNSHAAELWSQYHLIGDVMRGANTLSPSFKQNLMAKIDLEPTVLSPNAAVLNQHNANEQVAEASVKLPASWSIAASFAAVMVVGWMVLQTQTSTDFAPTSVAASAALPVVQASTEQTIPDEYLMAHHALAPTASSYYIQSVNYSD